MVVRLELAHSGSARHLAPKPPGRITKDRAETAAPTKDLLTYCPIETLPASIKDTGFLVPFGSLRSIDGTIDT